MRPAAPRRTAAAPPWGGRRKLIRCGRDESGGLGRLRLGPHGPVHDRDQVEDRELQDEHQKDDLDHGAILGTAFRAYLEAEDVRPVVVTGSIEALALLEQPFRLQARVEDRLLVVRGAGEVRAVRS